EWGKDNGSFDPTLRFAQPQDDTPLNALPPSDGRSRPGDQTPLLPLPNWTGPVEPSEKAPVKSLDTASTSRGPVPPPKAQLIEDTPTREKKSFWDIFRKK